MIIAASCSIEIWLMPAISAESSNSLCSDTDPADSYDSKRLNGLILNRDILPVPVCAVVLSAGTAEPVKINCPVLSLWSTVNRTASQRIGAICHSSRSRGVSPSSKSEGLIEAVCKYADFLSGSCIISTLFAVCWAVLVFPHHLGPSIKTAPEASSAFWSMASAIRGK